MMNYPDGMANNQVRRIFFSLVIVSLCGCAATVTFVDRTDGHEYIGKSGGTGRAEGELSALIEGSTYTGHWIYTANGGGYSLATGAAFSGRASAFGSASAVNIFAQGNGLINIRSDTGQFMRCVFNFNGMSNTGIGECQRNDGREYDLRIKR